jgi:hypothetical protein
LGGNTALGPVDTRKSSALAPATETGVTDPTTTNILVDAAVTIIVEPVTVLRVGEPRHHATDQITDVVTGQLPVIATRADPIEAGGTHPEAFVELPITIVVDGVARLEDRLTRTTITIALQIITTDATAYPETGAYPRFTRGPDGKVLVSGPITVVVYAVAALFTGRGEHGITT